MGQKITAPMVDAPDVTGGWRLVFAAVDPTTGAAVSGVTVSHATLLVDLVTGEADSGDVPAVIPYSLTLAELNGEG